ncbi:NAD-dependent epimerase/dehydratase family protein [Rhodospirillum sp. A1_3_36]|uniref:NAD-dependent epimerase/dehydratase family protein n=1 Tax=Rhodospirillum sp. A1_3_36 TaxID=3391666 RepID=UPI0039A5387C
MTSFEDMGAVLVAGGSGFLGSNLVARLARDGVGPIRATWRSRQPHDPPAGVEWVQADLRDAAVCERVVQGIDTVFLCAAHTSGAAVITGSPLSHVTPNVLINTLLLEAAHNAGVKRVVFLSTGSVYPDTKGVPVKEEDAFSAPPFDTYFAVGWMKRYTETLCRTYAEKIPKAPMSTVVIRPANVYGPGDKFGWKTSHVTAAQIRKVFERQNPIEVWGTGKDVRDVIFVDDFIEGVVRAARVAKPYLEVNIASGTGITVLDILHKAMEIEGHEAEVYCDPTKPSTVPILLFETGRAQTELGFTAKTSLAEGMERTFAWLRATPQSVWDR